MDIFESLENLNVSEECFDEIMGLVEDTLSQIKKVYGEPEYNKEETGSIYDPDTLSYPANKAAELYDKAKNLKYSRRIPNDQIRNKYTPKKIVGRAERLDTLGHRTSRSQGDHEWKKQYRLNQKAEHERNMAKRMVRKAIEHHNKNK